MSLRARPLTFACFLAGLGLGAAGCADDTGPGAGGTGGAGAGDLGGGGESAGGAPSTGGGPSGGGGATSDGGGGAGGSAGGECLDVLTCDADYPDLGATIDWNHFSSSVAAAGFVNHRGRDMFYNPGDTVWVMAKFAYGLLDDDIKDEEVDVWLNRGCGAGWELVGTELTTDDAEHPTVEGVEDTGGWVFFDATDLDLEEGRHRFLLSVGGDRSTTEVYVDVVPAGTPVIVTDIDGTLTTEENEEFSALLTGALPQSNPDSADVLTALAEQGYRVFYLTARPHFLGQRTREFLAAHQYPLGVVHTTLTFTGATGDTAVGYKSDELAAIAARGLVPSWAFGNTARRQARRPRRHPRVEPRAPPRALPRRPLLGRGAPHAQPPAVTRRRSGTSRAHAHDKVGRRRRAARCSRCWRSSSRTCPRTTLEHVIVMRDDDGARDPLPPTGTSTTRPSSPPSPTSTPGPRSTRTPPR
jgi:hypothetical protein